jgi:CHAT domain-containing protein/Tfp pilus assembly protein PilF
VGVSPVEPVLSATTVEIGDQDHQFVPLEAPPDSHVLITVTGRDVDVRAAIVNADGTIGLFADAPNRRMGIETLLLEPPHDKAFSVRIERNDHGEARGVVTVEAVALPVATEADRRLLEALRLEATADQQFSDLSKGEETAAAYVAAADLHEKNDDDRRAGIALLHAAGARYARLADWRGAANLVERAERELDDGDEPELAAFALRVEGAALDLVANASDEEPKARERLIAQARQQLTEAARRFEVLGMAYEAGYALNYRGVSFLNAGDRDRARTDFQRALESFQIARDGPAQALSLQSLALLSHEDGRLADAMREFDQALALIPRDEDAENYAHTLHNSALPLRVLGRFDEAIARYYEAGQVLSQLGDRAGEARALHGLGTTLRYAGEPERAIEFLRAAIELRSETGAKREQAISLIVLGQIERDQGNTDAAVAFHRQAAALVSSPNDRAKALLALAQDHVSAGDLTIARQELDKILRLGLPATHRHLGLAWTEFGILESSEGHAAASNKAFARAIAVHKATGSEFEQARTLYRRAEAMQRAGDTQAVLADTAAALRLFEGVGLQGTQAESRALFRATYRSVVELRISAFLANAAASRKRGEVIPTQQLLRTALAVSEGARFQLLTEGRTPIAETHDASTELLERRREIYELLAGKRQRQDQLLDVAAPDTQQLAALSKDIALLRAEATLLESRLAKTRTEFPNSTTIDDSELMQAIPADALVAEYFLGDSHSWLFEVRNGEVTVHTLPRSAELETLARQLHFSWRSVANVPGDRFALSGKLAGLILRPLGESAPAGELRIIPDGALHVVPMALLAQQTWPDMRQGTATIFPSLSARHSALNDREAIASKTLAVIADPVYAVNDSRIRTATSQLAPVGNAPLTRSARDWSSLQRLPATSVEAREIMALVNNPSETLALIGLDANRKRVATAALDDYRIVHFATHALADSQDPALATLALSRWDGAGKPLDGALRLYDITQLRLNADLVVLSGCDTMLGREIAGEGPIGLSQAFLRSGARSVLATLWQVSDSSTAVLMREFYEQLLTNKRDASVALQLAQDHVRKQPRWSDPYYWAGFQLVSMARIDRNNKVEGPGE